MHSIIVSLFIAAVLLLSAILMVFLWEKTIDKSLTPKRASPSSESSFRAFYHFLWILVFLSGIAFSMPLWLSFKAQLSASNGDARILLLCKASLFPLVLVALLYYGRRKGYVGWINDASWPDKENDEQS